jgi:FtsP/CotA-like multicopper oxidase with cupredoxin domain
VLPAIGALPDPARSRPLALIELMSDVHDGPSEAVLGTVNANGEATHQMWSDAVSENPSAGDTEVWEFHNFTEDAHPMHIHEVAFEVVNRQEITFTQDEMGHIHDVELTGSPRGPESWESGFKDTVIAYPGEVTRVRMKFVNGGQFVWHCHIVEHEDNEMMRPYRIGPVQAGQPE